MNESEFLGSKDPRDPGMDTVMQIPQQKTIIDHYRTNFSSHPQISSCPSGPALGKS